DLSETGGTSLLNDLDLNENVASFTTDPLPEGLDIDGYVEVALEVEASSGRADWFLWLAEVNPLGDAIRLTAGGTRRTNAPGSEQISVSLGPISHVVSKGHRVRLYIGNSNSPLWNTFPA